MIEVNELRLGNFVSRTAGDMPVKHINEDMVGFADGDFEYPKYLSPIPLSPEILKKCGFRSEQGSIYSLYLKYGYLEGIRNPDTNYYAIYFCIDVYESDYALHESHIKYLHQLQNLYFVLIGEELKVNL